MAERDAKKGKGWIDALLFYALLGILGWALGSIIVLPAKIDKATEVYLCVEIWKLGKEAESCDHLRGEQ